VADQEEEGGGLCLGASGQAFAQIPPGVEESHSVVKPRTPTQSSGLPCAASSGQAPEPKRRCKMFAASEEGDVRDLAGHYFGAM